MKKHLVWILAALLSLGVLYGCGSSSSLETSETAAYLKDIKADEYVTLGTYTGMTINVAPYEITQEDIDNYMELIVLENPKASAIDGPAEVGDSIVIDFVGKIDGVAFEDGTAESYPYTLGSYQFISDLDEGMVGMSVGEVRDVPVTFPENYSPELAGQAAVFTVTVQSIERPDETTELNDEYIEWLTSGQYVSVVDFRAYLEEAMMSDAQAEYENNVINRIADAVIENATFKAVPTGIAKRINASLISTFAYYASVSGVDLATYLLELGIISNYDEAEAALAAQAELSTKRYVAYQAIADIEGLNITDEDVELALMWEALSSGMSVEDYQAQIDMEGYREYLMLEKVAAFLAENNNIENAIEN
jgi:trigger factor